MMLEVVDAAETAAPDYLPAILGFVGVLVGGVLAWIASLIGAANEAKRESERWKRDQRMEAYVAVARALDGMPPLTGGGTIEKGRVEAYLDNLKFSLAGVQLLGPESVYTSALAYFEASAEEAKHRVGLVKPGELEHAKKVAKKYHAARTAFLASARHQLGISD